MAVSCQLGLSSIHSFLAIHLASIPNPDLISLGFSLLRCIRTICTKWEHDHCPQVKKKVLSGQGFDHFLIPRLPFTVQGNGLLVLYFWPIPKKCTYKIKTPRAYCQFSSSLRFRPRWSHHPFSFVTSSSSSLTPLAPGSLHTTLPSPGQAFSMLTFYFLLSVVGSKCEGEGARGGQIRLHFHMKQVRLSR